jgi:Fe-S cluster assembly ATP-binding protein
MLKIKNVSAIIDTTEILSNISLEIKRGEIHAILGPASSGKSTLAHLIQGSPYITQSAGTIHYQNKDIKKLKAHKRSEIGIFTSFQHPPEIEGLSNKELMQALYEVRAGSVFNSKVEQAYKQLIASIGLHPRFCDEPVNSSMLEPDEWRKSEIIQLVMLLPELIILDEIDLHLDRDSLIIIIDILKKYLDDHKKSVIVITHSKELLDYLEPSHVHVLVDGEIRESGTGELYKRILEDGYSQFS